MAAILCYCLCILYRYGAGKKLCFLFLLFYACVPYNGNFAVTMWKDVLFSGFLLLFGLFVYQLLHLYSSGERLKKKPGLLILLLLSGLLVCLFRSNGLYLFLLTLPFLVLGLRREWKLLLPGLLLTLRRSPCASRGPSTTPSGWQKPAFSESLSIPAQQIARVVHEGRDAHAGADRSAGSDRGLRFHRGVLPAGAFRSLSKRSDPVRRSGISGRPQGRLSEAVAPARPALPCWITGTPSWTRPAATGSTGEPGLTVNESISPNDVGLSGQSVLRQVRRPGRSR